VAAQTVGSRERSGKVILPDFLENLRLRRALWTPRGHNCCLGSGSGFLRWPRQGPPADEGCRTRNRLN